LLITLKPLRGPSVGVQPPTDAEKFPLKKRDFSDKVKLRMGIFCAIYFELYIWLERLYMWVFSDKVFNTLKRELFE
jgi:hypothetical protein